MWLIIGSLIFGYIGLYVPGIKVQYQIIESGKNITPLETRLVNVWGDKDGRDIPPCDLGSVEWSSKQLHWTFIGFRMFGIGAQWITFSLWYFYATRRDIGKRKFFFILVGLVWVPVALLVIFGSRQANLCNSLYVYEIMNFTPYYPALLLWIIGLALGYLAYRAIVQTVKTGETAKNYAKS